MIIINALNVNNSSLNFSFIYIFLMLINIIFNEYDYINNINIR